MQNSPGRSMTQKQLPLKLHETRAAKLQRLLSGELAKHVQVAAVYFDEAAYREATARAQADAVGPSSPRSDVGPIGRAKDLTRLDR